MISHATIHAVVGRSCLLRDRRLAELLSDWQGPQTRSIDDADLPERLLALATPSLFAAPGVHVVTLDERALGRQQARLVQAAQQPPSAGHLVLLLPAFLPKRATPKLPADALGPLLEAQGAVHRVSEPDPRRLVDWLVAEINADPAPAEQARDIAEALLRYQGADVDTLLQALALCRTLAGDEVFSPLHVRALMNEVAEAPVYEFTNAFVAGEARRCLVLLYAGQGLSPEMALGALGNELRKMLACLEHEDDKEVYRRAGLKGRPGRGMYYVRKRASGLGRRCLTRLLNGVLQTQRSLRQNGTDALLAMETLVLNAQRVIR